MSSDPRRNVLRDKRVMIGAAGLALAALAGVAVATNQPDDAAENTAAQAPPPATTPAATQSGPVAGPVAGPVTGPVAGVAPTSTTSAKPKTVLERAAEARTANERMGTTVRRPLPVDGRVTDAPQDLRVVNIGSLRETGKSLRVVTARADLTGRQELRFVADEGKPVGKARCSQNVQTSEDVPARIRPTLLFCWRTSATKSAFTVAVVLKGKPSATESVAKLNEAYNKL
ncbi:hypothetical protein [Paractinoplanes lichenicola]|uniref:Uncharacterized protein n=1 Tax=Paractinoplanes lichenicola TaxID=2802976 RepID=A0ABS1VLE6_9ACTN|nr:hypothetical protein [Actinoplanes lichenicola]MBL7254311.1 hypothetical protein [Actinoplanes lichenicola]